MLLDFIIRIFAPRNNNLKVNNMFNVIRTVLDQPLRAAVSLAATLILASCSTNPENTEDLAPVSVQVAFDGFNVSTSPLSRAESTEIPTEINRIALKVFNGDGTEVSSIAQKQGDDGFGTVSLTLVPGSYNFVCVMNQAKAIGNTPLENVAAATITSTTEATIPGTLGHDTYCCTQSVTITQTSNSISLNMGSRVNARFVLKVTDKVPAAVKTLAIIINPDAAAPTDGCLSINPSTGRATAATKYLGTKNITAAPNEAQMDIYIPETSFITKVRIEARDNVTPTPNILYDHTIENVPFASNQRTNATGRLFDSTASCSFTFSTDTWTDSPLISF